MSSNNIKLKDILEYNTKRINITQIDKKNYISTENMKSNYGGISRGLELPNTDTVRTYKNDDILISNIRPYFKKIWLANKSGGCSSDVLVLRLKENLNIQFLYYSLANDDFFDYVMLGAKGTKMPRGDKKHILNYEILLPNDKVQNKIANILSTLDEKIELNNQMNKTLEEMAQTIYKSWFVDFEPFQDGEFVESDLGMIPEGWEVKKIKNIGKVVLGKTPLTRNKKNYGNKYPFIKIPDLHDEIFVTKTEKMLSEKGHKTQEKKLLPQNSIIVSCIGSVGLVALNLFPSHTNQQINSIVCDEKLREYLYFNMKSLKPKLNKLGAGGTTIKNVNKTTFQSIQILKPSDKILNKYHNHVNKIFENIKNNIIENSNIKKIRDSLLPKLMSGEIRVPLDEEESS